MKLKHELLTVAPLTAAYLASIAAIFFTPVPFLALFSAVVFIVLAIQSTGKIPIAFVFSTVATLIGIFCLERLAGPDVVIVPIMIVTLWLGNFLLYWHQHRLESNRWKNLVEKDEKLKEVKNLKSEITLYERRHEELARHTAQRKLLSNAARELGAFLDPTYIQNKLVEITKLIFPGQRVELTYGQYRDAIDTLVFQKRQPVLVPSHNLSGVPLIAAPISVQRSVAGVLKVGGEGLNESRQPYNRDDLRLLEILASLASLAMDNCQLFQQVQQSALRDNLTGLLTHKAFQEELEAAVLSASRYGQPLSLILFDVDYFKSVNDNYGHQAGDQVLQGFAHILDRNVRGVDIIARYGGEEFAILLLQTSHREACELAERIRIDLADQGFELERGMITLTGSFGVATFPEDATSAQQLFRQADQRLYKAKNSGRNQVRGR